MGMPRGEIHRHEKYRLINTNKSVVLTERTLREDDVLNHSVTGNGIIKKAAQLNEKMNAGVGRSTIGKVTGWGMHWNHSVSILNDLDKRFFMHLLEIRSSTPLVSYTLLSIVWDHHK